MSAALCAAAIPLLKKLNARQYILGYVEEHKSKGGTPTMGGLAFLLAAALCSLLFGLFADKLAAVALTFGLAYMGVGFLDDFLKFRFRRNLGLKAYQKIVFQIVVAVIAGVFCYLNELTVLHIPFTRISFDIGIWIIPLAAFAFVAATNCVNLTDGLDGLAASVSFGTSPRSPRSFLFFRARRRSRSRACASFCAVCSRGIFSSTRTRPPCSWATRACSVWAGSLRPFRRSAEIFSISR